QRLPLDQICPDDADPQVKPAFRLLGPSAHVSGPAPGPFTIPSGPSRSAAPDQHGPPGPTAWTKLLDQAPGPKAAGPTPWSTGLDQARLVRQLGAAGQGSAIQQRGPGDRGPPPGEPWSTALGLLGPRTRP